MAKINRFDGNVKAFASEAQGTERTIFGDTAQSNTLDANLTANFLRGWGIVGVNENPTKQDFAGLGFTLGELISYLHQVGIPEWNTAQEFYEGSVVTTLAGIYRLKASGDGTEDPDTDEGVNWEAAPTRAEIENRVIRVTSIAAMEAYSAPVGYVFSLNAGGRSGVFDVVAGDFSTELAADTENGIYIGLADDPTATDKVLKRRIEADVLSEWWGVDWNTIIDAGPVINNMLRVSENKNLVFEGGLTIPLDPTNEKIVIGENRRITMNGSVFSLTSEMTGSYGVRADYAVQVVGDNINGDRIEVQSIGTTPSCTIWAEGNHIDFGALYSENDVEETSGGGIFLGSNTDLGSKYENLRIGSIETKNHVGGVSLKRFNNFKVGFVEIDKYRRGLFIESASNGVIDGGHIFGRYAGGVTSGIPLAGTDGILIQTRDGDRVTNNITINNIRIEDANEYGVYIAGHYERSPSDIYINNCVAINTGSTGFNVRTAEENGGTSAPNRAININLSNCTVIDAGSSGGVGAGFSLHGCTHSSLTNPKVYALFNTFSCTSGILIRGCQSIDVVNPSVANAELAGIASTQSGANYLGETAYIHVEGGRVRGAVNAVYLQPSAVRPIRNFTIDGLACYTSQGNDFLSDTLTFSGSYINRSCSASFTTSECTGTNFSGDWSDWCMTARGLASAPGIGAVPDGSTFSDLRGGFQIRKAGAWVAL